MKKFILISSLLALIAAGAFFGWKMLKGEGGCCGWGGDNVDPWTTYTPPAEDASASPTTSSGTES